jgi:hypothetical protein
MSASPRTCVGTCEKILKIVPETEPLHAELKAFVDGIFFELPETAQPLWAEVARILNNHLARSPIPDWQKAVEDIWFNRGSEEQPHSGTIQGRRETR